MILSIIIPVFDVEGYVGKCLESVLGSTDSQEQFEVIAVNDGSKDGSLPIVRAFQDRFPNLIVLDQENQGISGARMNGLALAQGDYVWFIDSDDWLKPGAIDTTLQLIRENQNVDAFMFPIDRTYKSAEDYSLHAPLWSRGMDVLLNHRFPVYSVYRYIIRRTLFGNKSLFFPKGLLHEDEYFGRVLLALAEHVYIGNESVYSYCLRSDSIMRTISIRSSYDYVSNYILLKDFARKLPKTDRERFLLHSQRILKYSYTIQKQSWSSPEFRRFKRKKGPYILSELLQNARSYSFRELVSFLLLVIAPNTFRRLYPAN